MDSLHLCFGGLTTELSTYRLRMSLSTAEQGFLSLRQQRMPYRGHKYLAVEVRPERGFFKIFTLASK